MNPEKLLELAVSKPEPERLWEIRKAMLGAGFRPDDRAMVTINAFYTFVSQLIASSSARQYSHFASLLDLGAIAGVALQNLLESSESESWSQRLLAGGFSEILMVLAARQYVKAWDEEMQSVYDIAAWQLGEEFWYLSAANQPELSADMRHEHIERLLSPFRDDELSGTVKAAICIHYFQLLLLAQLKSSL